MGADRLRYLRRLISAFSPVSRRSAKNGCVRSGGGGTMASMLALASRDVLSGLATSVAPLPRLPLPDNDPAARLAILAGLPTDESQAAIIRQGLKKLSDAGYSVTSVMLASSAGTLSADERELVGRWIDRSIAFRRLCGGAPKQRHSAHPSSPVPTWRARDRSRQIPGPVSPMLSVASARNGSRIGATSATPSPAPLLMLPKLMESVRKLASRAGIKEPPVTWAKLVVNRAPVAGGTERAGKHARI